jgi:hypothetical protein
MKNMPGLILSLVIVLLIGIIMGFIIGAVKNLKKIRTLNYDCQKKIGLLDNYMTVGRKLTKEELVTVCNLPVEEIRKFNAITDIQERIKIIKETVKR